MIGPETQEVHGLFVGIDEYHIGRQKLKGCENDAFHLRNAAAPALTTNVLLTNKAATREAILDNIEGILAKSKKGDLFLFFCACHGAAKYGEFFLLPSDHDPRAFLGTALLFQDIVNSMGSYKDVNTLTIIDACQSGAIGFDPGRINCGQRSSIMAASAPLEVSNEFKVKVKNIERNHGVFAYGLIQQLNEILGEGGSGSISHIFNKAYYFTKTTTTDNDSLQPQHPVMVGTLPASLMIRRIAAENEEQVREP